MKLFYEKNRDNIKLLRQWTTENAHEKIENH